MPAWTPTWELERQTQMASVDLTTILRTLRNTRASRDKLQHDGVNVAVFGDNGIKGLVASAQYVYGCLGTLITELQEGYSLEIGPKSSGAIASVDLIVADKKIVANLTGLITANPFAAFVAGDTIQIKNCKDSAKNTSFTLASAHGAYLVTNEAMSGGDVTGDTTIEIARIAQP